MNLLNQLPLPQRSVLLLHFVEDFSLEKSPASPVRPSARLNRGCTMPRNRCANCWRRKNENPA